MPTPDIFISYARNDADTAQRFAEAFGAEGLEVWWDNSLEAGEVFDEVIEQTLRAARAVVVLWSPDAVASRWVRAEATLADQNRTLVPAMIAPCSLPIVFGMTQTADLSCWNGDQGDAAWQQFLTTIRHMVSGKPQASELSAAPKPVAPSAKPAKVSIAVLPFANMSNDAEQEYFSDGITEDIITDLSKVSALRVISRNSAFTFKGKHVDLPEVARQLGVSHVLEGSVRKAGNRVRVTAQLIDGANNDHVWAERYDRDLDDIFELQDELSEAIVKALKVSLLPEEKKAIERRGTDNVEAYNLVLMARQDYLTGIIGNRQHTEAVIRMCRRATEFDPDYADAWALMALAQTGLHRSFGEGGEEALAAAERALELNPDLAEAHAVKAILLDDAGRTDEAFTAIETALRLDPDSYEANGGAAMLRYRGGQFEEAAALFERATALEEADFMSAAMLASCYNAIGDKDRAIRASEMTVSRCEKILEKDRHNSSATAMGASALSSLGEIERAREWMNRALLVDPDNHLMRYNFACALAVNPETRDEALDMLESVFAKTALGLFSHAKIDPDFDLIRDDPRFEAMVAEAEARLVAEKQT